MIAQQVLTIQEAFKAFKETVHADPNSNPNPNPNPNPNQVPAHDERDFEFATEYDLPIKVVVEPAKGGGEAAADGALEAAFTDYGVSVNSGEGLDGLATEACKAAVIARLEGESKGESVTTFKLRDWVFSRQRYWGEPIPIVFPVTLDEAGGDPRKGAAHTIEYARAEAVPESELPVKLPELANFEPGDDPQGCLARCVDWRYFQKEDGSWWARETNTMPQVSVRVRVRVRVKVPEP